MKRINNPGYGGSPAMQGEIYNDINIFGNPGPPPTDFAMITEITNDLMITEISSDIMTTE